MEIVIQGRNVEVPERYRQMIEDKLRNGVGKYDQRIIRTEVTLLHEPNRRQREQCQRVELTCHSRGPVIRAEARAKDFMTAWELAYDKLRSRLRKLADRRRVHHGRRTPVSVGEATAALQNNEDKGPLSQISEDVDPFDGLMDEQLPGRIVREKSHPGDPMTIDDALFHMELVGHDFYLFNDKESGQPSVVYRRKGFDYGILRLQI